MCGIPKLQHVTVECGAYVVLCPGTRLRSRNNREYHTEQLREGYWALHFGWKRGPCTNSSAGCTKIFSRRTRRKDLCCIVPAPAIIVGRMRENGEAAQWTFRQDSAGGVPTAAHGERSTTSSPRESYPDYTGISSKKNIAEAKQRSTTILGLDLNSGLG